MSFQVDPIHLDTFLHLEPVLKMKYFQRQNGHSAVVYFDQHLGAVHSSHFPHFCTFLQDFDAKMTKNGIFLACSQNNGCHKNAGLDLTKLVGGMEIFTYLHNQATASIWNALMLDHSEYPQPIISR